MFRFWDVDLHVYRIALVMILGRLSLGRGRVWILAERECMFVTGLVLMGLHFEMSVACD